MNEDARSITPSDVTAMTVEPAGSRWRVTIEQGNGDVLKVIELTNMERIQLSLMLGSEWERPVSAARHASFLDYRQRPESVTPASAEGSVTDVTEGEASPSVAETEAAAAPVEVAELTEAEGRELLDRRCREELGISGPEFLGKLDRGEYGDYVMDEAVIRLQMLIPYAGRRP
ncbi:MAG: hypothetical protein M3Y33_09915 [Actinomycetota bacterium]|nr:hypothetical protein [Actinomycetota bacterium]